jgi:hypothetical protein
MSHAVLWSVFGLVSLVGAVAGLSFVGSHSWSEATQRLTRDVTSPAAGSASAA